MQTEFNRIRDRGWTAFYITFRKFAFFALVVASSAISPIAAKAEQGSSPVGLWKTEDAQVEIFEADGKLSGKIAALNKEYTSDGIEKTDISNPDPAKRSRPLIGLVFMTGFTPEGPGRWDHGTVYDPKTGHTYASFLEYDGGDTVKLRGYIGISLIGRTAVWTKVKE
ncbi:MAG: DUF2147 domain-containing protein [Verrucomicrobia bacterium]|nr:DUF2147 domain-containing protein [Verrucomicrobiota bacterium]MBV8482009.1 DUF2147 domain-containing protein [Verrucomicrobiota bacterium]